MRPSPRIVVYLCGGHLIADLPSDGAAANHRRDVADPREQTAQARLAAADERDVSANARDAAAAARDELAGARYRAVARQFAQDGPRAIGASERMIRAAGERRRSDRVRAEAAEQGALADRDRRVAAQDRELAACERLHALVDRELLADALAEAEVDPLTGARMRAAGLADLDRELLCCSRTSRSLVVAYVDVVGLKTLNDTEGHGAGDALLVRVVALLRQHMRSYDLIIRLGGDEFLCTMTGVALPDVRRRFVQIAAKLSAGPGSVALRTGFSELTAGDTTVALIARADAQMLGRPHGTHAPRSVPRSLGAGR